MATDAAVWSVLSALDNISSFREEVTTDTKGFSLLLYFSTSSGAISLVCSESDWQKVHPITSHVLTTGLPCTKPFLMGFFPDGHMK